MRIEEMIGRVQNALIATIGLLLAVACAPLPAQQAEGTPAALVARDSTGSIQASGVSVGAGIAVDHQYVITNAHVVRQASGRLTMRRADGMGEADVQLVGTSPNMDLAVLRMPAGFLQPAATAPELPQRGEPVWGVGPEGLGRSLAMGHVTQPAVQMAGFGPGFTAGMGALMGFSGGPVVDRSGRVMGLTTALPEPGSANVLAMLVGVDVAGFAHGNRRQVFILDIREALDEARRMGALPQLRLAGVGQDVLVR